MTAPPSPPPKSPNSLKTSSKNTWASRLYERPPTKPSKTSLRHPPPAIPIASERPSSQPATATAAHSFQLRRLLPDSDTTTPADAFPDPANPGQTLRLAKTPLLDYNALNSATLNDHGLTIDLTDPGPRTLFKARSDIAPEPFRIAAVIDSQLLPPGELRPQIDSGAIYYLFTPIAAQDLPTVQRLAAVMNALVFQRPGAILRGQLLDKPGGKGVPNVPITLALADQTQTSLTTTTGPDGSYQFPNVPPTRQSFFFRIDKQPPGERFSINFSEQDIGQTKTLTLYANLPVISGVVLDKQTHQPVPFIQVETYHFGGSTKTDEQGAYRISYVPGSAYNRIMSPGERTRYLPSSKTFDAKTAQDFPNFDLELETVPTVEFDVVVLGPDGKPAPNATLDAKSELQLFTDTNYLEMNPPFVSFAKPATDAQGKAHATVYFPGERGLDNFKKATVSIKLSAQTADKSAAADTSFTLTPDHQPPNPLQLRTTPAPATRPSSPTSTPPSPPRSN